MRIVLAEDEALLREGLARLLNDAGFEVVGKAADAAGLLRLVDARRPELVLTDIRMPPAYSDEGLEAAQEIGLAADVSVFEDRVRFEIAHDDAITARWSVEDGDLRFSDVKGGPDDDVVFGTKPWRRVR